MKKKRTPRVLMVTVEYGPLHVGGLGSAVTTLCHGLDKSRIQPVVVLPRSGHHPDWHPIGERHTQACKVDIYCINGVEVWLLSNTILDQKPIRPRTPLARLEKCANFGECIGSLLDEMDVDIVHLHDSFGQKCLETAKQIHKAIVYTVHKLHRDLLGEFEIEKRSASLADVVTTVGRSYAAENHDFFCHARRSVSIANGIDPHFWSFDSLHELITGREMRRRALLHNLGLQDRVTFAYVGRLDPNQKGLDTLLDTLRNAPPDHDYNVLIVGDGSPMLANELKTLAESRPERIRFFGRAIPRTEVREIMGAIDFAILPSRFEPFGLVQLEAMAMGTLPIASATGGHKDVIIDIESQGFGRLFAPGDARGLGRAIEEMAQLRRDRPDDVNTLRIRAAAVAHCYSERAMARHYEDLYESVLGIRTAPHASMGFMTPAPA